MKQQDPERMGCLHGLALVGVTFGGTMLVGLLHAIVVRDLWAWFVAPTWNLATPSIAATYGALLMVSLIHYPPGPSKNPENDAERRAAWFRMLRRWAERAGLAGVGWLIGRAVLALSA